SMRTLMLSDPGIEASFKLAATLQHGGTSKPFLDHLAFELKEYTLALVLGCREPGGLACKRCSTNADFELAFGIWSRRFKPGEAHLCDHFTQPVHQDNALDGVHPGSFPLLGSQGASEERTVRLVIPNFLLGGHERFEFRVLDPRGLFAEAGRAKLDLPENLVVGKVF